MIDSNDVRRMIEHWIATPPNGYFSQGYGADVKSMLLRELTSSNADALLEKLRQDIPLLASLNDSQLSVQTETVDFDRVNVYIMIGGIAILLNEPDTQTLDQDFYDARAQ